MPLRCWLASAAFASQVLVSAQTQGVPGGPRRFVNPWVSVAQPNVPADPLEVVVNAEPVQDVAQRAMATKLLEDARFHSAVRRGPYDLKTRFTSSEGTWQIEDSSPGRKIYRWTVQGPSYSAVNLFLEHVIYSNQPATGIPLRVAQVHSAIFGHFPMYGPRDTMRMASGTLNGTAVTCVLVSHMFNGRSAAGPRRWEEYESCIEPQSGLLMSYSPVPGLYIAFDYSNAQHLRDITFPGKFTITEAGQTVAEAQVMSLTLPTTTDAAIYQPTGLNALGVGFPLTLPWKMQELVFDQSPVPNPTRGQFVVVRSMVSPDGTVSNAEVVASSDTGFNQKALAHASQKRVMMGEEGEQNGATPQLHEAFQVMLFPMN